MSPQKLALAFAVGVSVGIIPLIGTTTLLCTVIALRLRLNMPAIQTVNYFVYPLQLILFIPYLKIGTETLSVLEFNYSIEQITEMISNDLWNTIVILFEMNLYGLLLWLLTAPFIFGTVYFVCFFLFSKIISVPASNKETSTLKF